MRIEIRVIDESGLENTRRYLFDENINWDNEVADMVEAVENISNEVSKDHADSQR